MKNNHISIFDSLRGLMALWVALAHTYMTFGYSIPDPINKVINVAFAVDVFIILSGFVIFLLLDRQNESYKTFIIRRAFRLFPVYLLVLFVSAITLSYQFEVWQEFENSGGYWQGRLGTMLDTQEFFTLQFWTHLFLLQGLFGTIIPSSDYAFLEPAWSLSLEWQFYLIAPFIFFALKKSPMRVFIFSLLLGGLYGQLGSGFLPNQFYFFAIGIGSYYVYSRMEGEARLLVVLLFLCAGLILRMIPLVIWGSFFFLALQSNSWLIKRWLDNRLLNYLGQISYPVYVTHTMLIFPAFGVVSSVFSPEWVVLATMVVTLGLTLLCSHILHFWLERPCIAFGRKITSSFGGS